MRRRRTSKGCFGIPAPSCGGSGGSTSTRTLGRLWQTRCGATAATAHKASVRQASDALRLQDFKTCAVWQSNARSARPSPAQYKTSLRARVAVARATPMGAARGVLGNDPGGRPSTSAVALCLGERQRPPSVRILLRGRPMDPAGRGRQESETHPRPAGGTQRRALAQPFTDLVGRSDVVVQPKQVLRVPSAFQVAQLGPLLR